MKKLTFLLILFSGQAVCKLGKCNLNVKTVPYNFHRADKATKDWYIPYSTHFYWKENYCNTNIYYIDERYPKRGIEIQATIKKKKLKNPKNLDYYLGHKEWDELINFYSEDPKRPGVSHWKTKVGPFMIKSTAWMFAVDPEYRWWATYYCGKGIIQKKLTEGIDVRSTTLPMDPYILKKIKRMAIQAGVDPKLVKKIKPAPYKGCRVNGRGERKIIIENEPSPKDYSNKGIIGIDYDQGDSKEEGLCYPSKEIDYSSRTEPINLCNGDFKCYPTPKALGKLKMSVDLYYDVSPKVLFRWLTEVPKVSYWLGNFKVKVIGKDCPYGVGHVRRLTAPFIGDVDETITIYQPAKYIRYRVSKSKLMKDHIGEIELTPKNGGTQLKWRISYNATTGAKKILRKFFNSVLRSGTKKLKKKLERHIER